MQFQAKLKKKKKKYLMKDIEETGVYRKGFMLRCAKTPVFGLIFQKD